MNTDSIIEVICIDTCVTPSDCYLNDFRVDIQRGYAYITDSGSGAIIVVNLVTGQCRRLLSEHHSVKAQDMMLYVNGQSVCWKVNVDGIALDSFSITPEGEIYVSTSRTLHLPGLHHIYKIKIDPSSISDFNINEPKVKLYQNYPNPFQNKTTIKYYLESESEVTLKVLDLLGRELFLLDKGYKESGEHEVEFENKNLPDGFYIYSLQIGSKTFVKKMIIDTLK